jgi:tetratricopeptide (TPR) repeat protein
MGVAWVQHFSGNHQAAMEEALRARALAPNSEEAGNVLVSSYEGLGRYEDAARIASEQLCWGLPLDGSQLLAAYREKGRDGYWRKRLELMEAANGPPPVFFGYAVAHCELGNPDRAIDYLERMVEAHVGAVVFIGVDPTLSTLKGHPRYDALVKRAGLPTVSARRTVST